MNTIGENTERYVPTIILYEDHTYVGFITEKESNSDEIKPDGYCKFMRTNRGGYPLKEWEEALQFDSVHKISLGLYFDAACGLRENGKRYNLNKIKHELNNRK